jgi:hypothetical protein
MLFILTRGGILFSYSLVLFLGVSSDKGHIVFISANKIQKSSNDQIIINNLQIEHVKGLLNKVMQIPDQEVINELAEVLVQKGSPTALIVDSAYFLNNHPHYTVKEYIKKMTNDNELVKNYLEMTSLLNSLCKFSHKYLKFYPQILSKNEPWLHSNFGWA